MIGLPSDVQKGIVERGQKILEEMPDGYKKEAFRELVDTARLTALGTAGRLNAVDGAVFESALAEGGTTGLARTAGGIAGRSAPWIFLGTVILKIATRVNDKRRNEVIDQVYDSTFGKD